ncbi:hypothetical protein [Frondihabitans sp. VKM Ac-2883]|uniref:hypothetical protein n=1 Tax=Frondihabitans sp. VKM Ac-2883 TaxID=2783823 RepID=UPI00188A035E|nr:hypothetical protein [Frondihabitans sp. VKM Ac-2883]MBF4574666.1 hypothetical protein [Frondihabitans sp. VKM Ac-2883]
MESPIARLARRIVEGPPRGERVCGGCGKELSAEQEDLWDPHYRKYVCSVRCENFVWADNF